MHPPLILQDNAMCADLIIAFKHCHETAGYFERMLGQCNEQKRPLDACFKAQKKVTRKGLLVKAREDRERWRKACNDVEAN